MRDFNQCDRWGCRCPAEYHSRGFRYCARHYRDLAEEEWDRARKEARDKHRPREEAAKEFRNLLEEITDLVAVQEGGQ